MKKIKYYLETSVLNFAFVEDSPERRKVTLDFLAKIGSEDSEIYISDIVLDEIQAAPEPRKSDLQKSLNNYRPLVLEVDLEVRELAQKYIDEGIVPERYRNDALHIAVASVHDMDGLVSWNFRHIVRMKTRQEVNGVNKMLGYPEIELITPEEAF